MIWNEEREKMDRQKLRELQFELLRAQLERAYELVPFYRQAMRQRGLRPADIRSLEDLPLLPFTRKADFADNYPFGLLAVPKRELVRIHASSGTTGKPIVVAYTRRDLDSWREVCVRQLVAAGVTADDTMQIAMGYGLFTGALGWHGAAELLGAMVVPISAGNTRRQIMLIQDLETTVLCATPSYAIHIAEEAERMGVDLRESSLRIGIHGAEPWSEGMRREIEERCGLKAYDTYGLSEIVGPGVSAECELQNGLHVNEDHFLVEVVDPNTGEPLPPGAQGELVITTLTKEALPVIRYRTGDISSLSDAPCPCGRTLARMSRVRGRTDDMLIVRGVNVFPSQVEAALLQVQGIWPQYQIIVDRQPGSMDELEVQVELSPAAFSDEIASLRRIQEEAEQALQEALGISARVRLVEPGTIERSTGKAKRVIDRRAT